MKNFIIGLIAVVVSLTVMFSIITVSENHKVLDTEVPIKLEQPEFMLYKIPNDSLVFMACKYYGLEHDSIIVTQAKLETGNYQSYQCRVNNNLFGLYNSSKGEYFKFNNWWESVEAYKNKIQYRYKGGDYYQWLQKIGYAEDPSYVSKLKIIKRRFIDNQYV